MGTGAPYLALDITSHFEAFLQNNIRALSYTLPNEIAGKVTLIKPRRTTVLSVAAAAALLAGAVLVTQAWASSGTLSVGHGSAEPGGRGAVDIVAGVDGEGLGAWTVDVVYDPIVVAAVGCLPHPAGVCSTDYDPDSIGAGDTVRMTGASAGGLTGEPVLATIEFECAGAEGATDLEIIVSVFGDSLDDPNDVFSLEVLDGSFTCAEPTPEPTSQPTPQPAVELPESGSAGPAGDGAQWLIALLAAAGVLLLLSVWLRELRPAVPTLPPPPPHLPEESGPFGPGPDGPAGEPAVSSDPHSLGPAREELSRVEPASVEEFGPKRPSQER